MNKIQLFLANNGIKRPEIFINTWESVILGKSTTRPDGQTVHAIVSELHKKLPGIEIHASQNGVNIVFETKEVLKYDFGQQKFLI